MFTHAWRKGFCFFLQANDDASFSPSILQTMLQGFKDDELMLIGPYDKSLPNVFTQAMIRVDAHYEKYGTLYPASFINWGGDIWLTRTYKEKRSLFVGNVTNSRPHTRRARYQPCRQ